MAQAVERVHQRLHRAASALESANVAYAVVGGNAVAAWVSQVDMGAVRNTKNVDILLRRGDLDAAKQALAGQLLEVGLIDVSWVQLVPRPLAARLQELLDNPQLIATNVTGCCP